MQYGYLTDKEFIRLVESKMFTYGSLDQDLIFELIRRFSGALVAVDTVNEEAERFRRSLDAHRL